MNRLDILPVLIKSFEQEVTEETEDNLTRFLARSYKSFYPCCLSFLLFNHAVLVSFVLLCER
jgi:hypothetical protein